jgi:glyoxalase family protein
MREESHQVGRAHHRGTWGGVLFEMAINPPGFAIDEAVDHLGERLMLPPWLEGSRVDLERRRPRLTRPAAPVRP